MLLRGFPRTSRHVYGDDEIAAHRTTHLLTGTDALTHLLTHLVPEGVELALLADVDDAARPRVLLVHLHEVRLVDERLEARRVGRALVEPCLHVLSRRLLHRGM